MPQAALSGYIIELPKPIDACAKTQSGRCANRLSKSASQLIAEPKASLVQNWMKNALEQDTQKDLYSGSAVI